jgi:hypothetical protein
MLLACVYVNDVVQPHINQKKNSEGDFKSGGKRRKEYCIKTITNVHVERLRSISWLQTGRMKGA